MRRFIIIAAILVLASCSSQKHPYSKEVEDALNRLDQVMNDSEIFDRLKEERIHTLKKNLSNTSDSESRYWILDELCNEYNRYDLDSTIRYATVKLAFAEEQGKENLKYDAIFDLADIYIMSGMYYEAYTMIEKTDFQRVAPNNLLPRYYHLMNSMYKGFAHASDDLSLKESYEDKHRYYRRLLHGCLGDEDISKLYIKAEMLIDALEYDEAILALENWNKERNTTVHDNAIIQYMLGLAYKSKGDDEKALICYTESAICDLSTPIRDYKSLYELAEILTERRDFERASRYITRSINDADEASILINIENTNSLLPKIYNSYNTSIKSMNQTLYFLLIGISILLIMLLIITGVVINDRKKIAKVDKKLRKSNAELTSVNERLHRYIARLKESNEIKETYISRYIDLCSDYIGRLDGYRSELRKLSKSGGYDAILKELRSTDVIDKELADFYAQFDATFLDLFPDFIPQLNSLLKKDRRIESKDGLMTTELRVCALIRLGVTDSVKISNFLRRSVSTIYNYRVKVRNDALNEREDFEKEIMKIGKLS